MADEAEPFGAQLIADLKKLNRLDVVLHRFKYDQVQRLKCADREATVKFFLGCGYEFVQQLKTKTPAEVAQYLTRPGTGAADFSVIFAAVAGANF